MNLKIVLQIYLYSDTNWIFPYFQNKVENINSIIVIIAIIIIIIIIIIMIKVVIIIIVIIII